VPSAPLRDLRSFPYLPTHRIFDLGLTPYSQELRSRVNTLLTPGASKGRSARRLLFQSSPLSRPLRARDPAGSDAFAAAPYCGGSYLTPAKWQMCGGSCSQKPRTRVRTGGAVSPRLRRGPPSGLRFPQTRRSVRPFQAPRTRLRLEAAFGGLVLAGRKGRASHRHRSGLKIPARPLAAPATPAFGGSRPLLHWPASSSEERAGVPALGRYAAFGLPIDSTGTAPRIECHLCFHAQLLMDPTLSRMNLMRIPAQAPLHALRNTKPERGVQSTRFEAHTR